MGKGVEGQRPIRIIHAEATVADSKACRVCEVIAEPEEGLPGKIGTDAEAADIAVLAQKEVAPSAAWPRIPTMGLAHDSSALRWV